MPDSDPPQSPQPGPKPKRALTRTSYITLATGGVITQAAYGSLRALSLDHDRAYTTAAYGIDPIMDILANHALAGLSLVASVLLLLGNRVGWWLAIGVVTVGAFDALRVTEAPFGGLGFSGVLILRIGVLVLLATPVVRAIYGVLDDTA